MNIKSMGVYLKGAQLDFALMRTREFHDGNFSRYVQKLIKKDLKKFTGRTKLVDSALAKLNPEERLAILNQSIAELENL